MAARYGQQEHRDGNQKLAHGIVAHPHREFARDAEKIEPQKAERSVNQQRDDRTRPEEAQPDGDCAAMLFNRVGQKNVRTTKS